MSRLLRCLPNNSLVSTDTVSRIEIRSKKMKIVTDASPEGFLSFLYFRPKNDFSKKRTKMIFLLHFSRWALKATKKLFSTADERQLEPFDEKEQY